MADQGTPRRAEPVFIRYVRVVNVNVTVNGMVGGLAPYQENVLSLRTQTKQGSVGP